MFALRAALKMRRRSRRDFLWALGGLAAGWATVTEYPAAPASAILALLALSRVGHGEARGGGWLLAWAWGRRFAWRVAGLSACGVWRVSSELFVLRSDFVFVYAAAGIYGADVSASGSALKFCLDARGDCFLRRRFAGRGGWVVVVGRKTNRAAALVAGGIAAYYFLFNASFYWWKAGLSFGPRYAGAAFRLLCLGLAAAWERGRGGRRVLIGLAACSLFWR